MIGGGRDTSSAQVTTNNVNDGELELSAESTIPQHKPALRGKWSKIPIRLGSSSSLTNSIGIEASGSTAQTTLGGGDGVESTKQPSTSMDINGTAPLTTMKSPSVGDDSSEPLVKLGGMSAPQTIDTSNTTSHKEEKATENNNKDGDGATKLESGNMITTTTSGVLSSGGGGTDGRSSVKSARSSRANTNAISHATIANADALAYLQDEMIEVNLVGSKHEQRAGHPLHICTKCDCPIAMYGRLMPCQHIFCVSCARKCFVGSKPAEPCYICKQTPEKIEYHHDTASMFLCIHGKCKRGYLSEFALTEHQRLRNHLPLSSPSPSPALSPIKSTSNTTTSTTQSLSSSANERKRRHDDTRHHYSQHKHHSNHSVPVHSSSYSSSHSSAHYYPPAAPHHPLPYPNTRHYSPPSRYAGGSDTMDYPYSQGPIPTYYNGRDRFDKTGRPGQSTRPMRPMDPYARGGGSGGSWAGQQPPPGAYYPYY